VTGLHLLQEKSLGKCLTVEASVQEKKLQPIKKEGIQ